MSNSLDARLRGAAGALLVAAASIVFVAIGVLWFFLFFNEMSDLPRVAVLEYAIVDTGGTPENVVEHSVFLGHEALGQMPLRGESAEARHIEVLYTPQGEFRLRNVATERRLGLQYDRFFLTDRTYLLRDGDRIKLAGQTLDVALPDSDRLILTREDGATLLELPQSYYRTDALSQVWYDWISFSASLGGRLSHEPARWGERFGPRELIEIVLQRDAAPPIVVPFAELPENAVTIRRLGGQFLLSLRNARAIGICRAAGPCFELGRQAWPVRGDPVLGDLREIIVGRTTYSVDANERQLRLEPIGRAHWQTPEYVSEIRDTLPRKEDVIVDWTNTPFHRGLPAGPDAGVLAQAIGSLKTLAQFGGPVAASVPWVALGLLTLLVIIGIDEHWVRRFFVGVPNATLLTLALSPGLSTLRGLDTLAPIEILALLLAIGTILPFGVNFVVSGRRAGLGSEALFRQATQLKSSDRSAFLFLLAVTALTSVILVTSHGSAKAGNMGQNTGAAVFSVIGLFVLSGTIMTRSSRSLAFAVFWAALMVVVGLGTISLGRLALGQDMARYLELFHKHLAVLGIIAAVATWFGSLRLDVIIRGTKVILYLVTEDLRISPFQLVFAAVPAAIGALIIVPEFLVNSPPSVRVLYDGEISRLVAKATVIFAGLVILAFGTWAWYLGLRRSKEVAGKAGAAGFLHRRRNVLSPWFLIPSLVLAAVVYVTPETGIAGLQPSEATKTWLAFLFALLLARWVQSKAWRMPFEQGKSRSSILITCLLLAVVFAIGSYINFDLSPAAIVLMMAACMTAMIGLEWLRGLIPRRYLLPALVLIFGLLWFSGGGLSTPEAVVVAGPCYPPIFFVI
ncbi:MAG: hypothetical protein QNJ16_15470 [Rhodobacter sp.]|nr:hypothetical protein [Rhodobacter sp.]